MKFKTLSELEDYIFSELPEDSNIAYVSAASEASGKYGFVFGFDVEDDCDVPLCEWTKRWNSYYI